MADARLLAVSAYPVLPGRDGYALRVRGLLSELAARWTVTLVSPPDGAGADAGALPAGLVRRIFPLGLDTASLLPPEPRAAEPLRRFVADVARDGAASVAILFGGTEFLAFGGAPLPPAVADRIDCNTLTLYRGLRGLRRRRLPGALSDLVAAAHYERRIVRRFPATVVVGADDARWLRRIGGRDSVHVIPNGVGVVAPATPAEEAPHPTVTFTGVLSYRPNVEAAVKLASGIWPAVRAAVPDARLVLAGRAPAPEVLALARHPGVSVLADVPDLRPVLARAWVCAAPMWSGAGIKNKVLEAWALGRPVVLSRMAANGLALDAQAGRYVAADPVAFAARVVELLRDAEARHALGAASRALAVRAHGWPEAAARFENLLARVAQGETPTAASSGG